MVLLVDNLILKLVLPMFQVDAPFFLRATPYPGGSGFRWNPLLDQSLHVYNCYRIAQGQANGRHPQSLLNYLGRSETRIDQVERGRLLNQASKRAHVSVFNLVGVVNKNGRGRITLSHTHIFKPPATKSLYVSIQQSGSLYPLSRLKRMS